MEIKPDGTIILTIRVTFNPVRDADLIALIQAAPPRGLASTIREAMRSGVANTAVAVDDNFVRPDLGKDL